MVFQKANYFKEKLSRCNEDTSLPDEYIPGDDGEDQVPGDDGEDSDPQFGDDEDEDNEVPSDDWLELPADDNDSPVSNDMNEEEILDNGSGNREEMLDNGSSNSNRKSNKIGRQGYASTSRYWDCATGSCGCGFGGKSKLNSGLCPANALFEAPEGNQWNAKFYGTAAVSDAFGGCGRCYKLTAKANVGNSAERTTIVVKSVNHCDPSKRSCQDKHFQISAPGFDYSENTQCNYQNSEKNMIGDQVCSKWMINNQNPLSNCKCKRITNPVLRKGCYNFRSLNWDNPKVVYQ